MRPCKCTHSYACKNAKSINACKGGVAMSNALVQHRARGARGHIARDQSRDLNIEAQRVSLQLHTNAHTLYMHTHALAHILTDSNMD